MMITNVISKIREARGNEKIRIMEDEKSEMLEKSLLYCYNPYWIYGIQKKSYDKARIDHMGLHPHYNDEKTLGEFFIILQNYAKANGVTTSQITAIKEFIKDKPKDIQELLEGVLFKDLKLGIDGKTIQKVFPSFPVYTIQKANTFSGGSLPFENNRVSRKFDGLRFTAIKVNGEVFMLSSNGIPFPHFYKIKNQLAKLDLDNYVYDGEVGFVNDNGLEDFKKALKAGASKNVTPWDNDMRALVFDKVLRPIYIARNYAALVMVLGNQAAIPLTPGSQGMTSAPFLDSYTSLMNELVGYDFTNKPIYSGKGYFRSAHCPNIYLVEQRKVDTWEELSELFKYAYQQKWEGLMLRNADHPYEFKRHKHLLKMKQFETGEFNIINFVEGTGRLQGTLGAVVIDYDGFQVKVGSGFSDRERKVMWATAGIFLNNPIKIKIQYKQKSKNSKGGESLQFPTFLCLQHPNGAEATVDEIVGEYDEV